MEAEREKEKDAARVSQAGLNDYVKPLEGLALKLSEKRDREREQRKRK